MSVVLLESISGVLDESRRLGAQMELSLFELNEYVRVVHSRIAESRSLLSETVQ